MAKLDPDSRGIFDTPQKEAEPAFIGLKDMDEIMSALADNLLGLWNDRVERLRERDPNMSTANLTNEEFEREIFLTATMHTFFQLTNIEKSL